MTKWLSNIFININVKTLVCIKLETESVKCVCVRGGGGLIGGEMGKAVIKIMVMLHANLRQMNCIARIQES